jgi:hypothetical protein
MATHHLSLPERQEAMRLRRQAAFERRTRIREQLAKDEHRNRATAAILAHYRADRISTLEAIQQLCDLGYPAKKVHAAVLYACRFNMAEVE